MRSKDTEIAVVKLPRCLVCGGMKVEWGIYYILRFVVNKRAISPIWVVVRTGFAAGVVPVSLRVFSGHTTMMYTMKVGSTTFTNLGRHQGLDLH